jgi:hypothetical protein
VREVILYLLTCAGLFLVARYSLFNIRLVLLSLTRGDRVDKSDKSQAIVALLFSLSLIVLLSISFGEQLVIAKGAVLMLFFALGIVLATHSDLQLQQNHPLEFEEREEQRVRNEFFYWTALLATIFSLALFALV